MKLPFWILAFLFGTAALTDLGNAQVQNSDDIFLELQPIYQKIDSLMGNGRSELTKKRDRRTEFDTKLLPMQKSSFGDQITVEVLRHLEPGRVNFSGYNSIFSVPSSSTKSLVSLVSHPMCESSPDELRSILRKTTNLSDQEVKYVQAFEKRNNSARQSYRENPVELLHVAKHWSALAGCLAYTESLGDPDTKISISRAKKLLGENFKKPEGVKVYYDKGHANPASRWNVGLYQFVLHKGGNIRPCLNSWIDQALPGSESIKGLDLKEMGLFVGSEAQSFNAFCGVNKILQSFYVQVNTSNPKLTHPENVTRSGEVKEPIDRCVSLNHRRAYAHFGPLIRSIPKTNSRLSNLEKVMACAVNSGSE